MGALEVTQIKRKLIDEFSGLLEYVEEEVDVQKNNLFLTRALAAYSIKMLYPNEENENIVKYIVDGSNDNGLDVIYYIKELNELCFVQSKFNHAGNSEPELGDIKKFLDGIRDLLQLKFNKFNQKINDLKEEIFNILNKEGLKYKAILVYTAINLSDVAMSEFREFKKEQNNANDIADFEIINQKRLYSSLQSSDSKINLEVALKEWGKYSGEMTSFYGHISASLVFNWWEQYRENLFDLNIRKMLGNTEINEGIIDTLDISPEKFWYFNNGVTMVCSSIEKKAIYGNLKDIGVFDCKGVSIVNGAQTIGCIGKFAQQSDDNRRKLEEAFIPIRIISVERVNEEGERYIDEAFARDVTKTNNRQNRIDSRDFLVLDQVQRKIESQLRIEGITYYLMRQEEELSTETSMTIKEATRALAFSKDIESTILVRTNIGLIHSDINHNRYKKLFNPSVTGVYVWNCVRIQREIEKCISMILKEEKIDDERAILIYSKEIISKVIFDLVQNIDKSKKISNEIIDRFEISNKIKIILDKVKESIKEKDKSLPNIFKNHNDMKEIYIKVGELLKIEKIKKEGEEKEFDIYEMDTFNYEEKKKLNSFIDKIKSDSLAFEFFKYWIKEKYRNDKYYFGYKSNLHFYIRSSKNFKATDKFIFRMAYYTKMIISFEFNSFDKYQSILLENEDIKEIINNNTDSKNRIIIDSDSNLKKAIELFNQILK